MRASRLLASLAPSGLVLATSCASAPPAAPTPPPAATVDAPLAVDAGAAAVATAEPEAEPHRPRPPIEVSNLCHDVALLAYGEPPNFKAESLGRFMGDANGTAARERDGTLAVTLVDDKGNVLAKVNVTRHMKKLEIGRSCRTLYAH
jgi:hypothetical protein